MKTYSQAQGKRFIDWNKRLSKKKITDEMWLKWGEDASSWVTCACGNQCDIIPRNWIGAPKDDKLRDLGGTFCSRIVRRDLSAAQETLKKIESRSIILINRIKKHGKI